MNKLIVITAVAAITQSHSAFGHEHSEAARTQVVRLADLNGASADGAAAVYRRVKKAAENVCRDLDPYRQLVRQEAYTKCIETAVGDAIVTIDRPAVTAYAEKRGVPLTRKVRVARANEVNEARL
jgi:UrcA family protein